MRKIIFLIIAFVIPYTLVYAQSTQTVKGKILDKDSKYQLVGASVTIISTNPTLSSTSDENGEFKILNVPIGRQTLRIRFLGYQEQTIPNILVNSGKEIFLNIELTELVITTNEVVITNKKDNTSNNEMAVVSARTFTVEETSK